MEFRIGSCGEVQWVGLRASSAGVPVLSLSLFPCCDVDDGLCGLYLRIRKNESVNFFALIGPQSESWFRKFDPPTELGSDSLCVCEWGGFVIGIEYNVKLIINKHDSMYVWSIVLENKTEEAVEVSTVHTQDVALNSLGAVRSNEYFVSQYVDHTQLSFPDLGFVLVSRQNLPVDGKHPSYTLASLSPAVGFTTDALQLFGYPAEQSFVRALGNRMPLLAVDPPPSTRQQHEHSLLSLWTQWEALPPRSHRTFGFFAAINAHQADATSQMTAEHTVLAAHKYAKNVVSLNGGEASSSKQSSSSSSSSSSSPSSSPSTPSTCRSLFSSAPFFQSLTLTEEEVTKFFGSDRKLEERDTDGTLLSFFDPSHQHIVLGDKEIRTLRPHGAIMHSYLPLLSPTAATPRACSFVVDETSLTTTVWMQGVFNSLTTQGHVAINRFLSTQRGYAVPFFSNGQRIFVDLEGNGKFHLLQNPSAFLMGANICRWVYKYSEGVIGITVSVTPFTPLPSLTSDDNNTPAVTLSISILKGPALRFLISHQIGMNGNDGLDPVPANVTQRGEGTLLIRPLPGTEVGTRFPDGHIDILSHPGTTFSVHGDEVLFLDHVSRKLPFLCFMTPPTTSTSFSIVPHLVPRGEVGPLNPPISSALTLPSFTNPHPQDRTLDVIGHSLFWYAQNGMIHYLSPRGLEQYTGGGWGARDVTQGSIELLLSVGAHSPARDILVRMFSAQNKDGNWPQFFMFFEREKNIRIDDSHGDIVFWPLLATAEYLTYTHDHSLLLSNAPYHPDTDVTTPIWQHIQKALEYIDTRFIPGTALISYGHGDWNDSLQPADPRMRDRLCSSWTVTLHFQTLKALCSALQIVGSTAGIPQCEEWLSVASKLDKVAERVRIDFERFLIRDGVIAGYCYFHEASPQQPAQHESAIPPAQDTAPHGFDAAQSADKHEGAQGHAHDLMPDSWPIKNDEGEEYHVSYLLHPSDRHSGLNYSSLPLIHSILSGIVTSDQANHNIDLIQEKLLAVDGCHLFDTPVPYRGGLMKYFQRAETSTFYGREIGLQYFHAHLRYAQMLAVMGRSEEFLPALRLAFPADLRTVVPSSTLRQANCYYSSSDAAVPDRYAAMKFYKDIVSGRVTLEGGWRLYSSGGGISVRLVLEYLIGVRVEKTRIIFDPVLPKALDGMFVEVCVLSRHCRLVYRIAGKSGIGVNVVRVNGVELPLQKNTK